jgi:PAS domain S-box-containing protein
VGKTLDSVIRSWNSAATRMFGYAPDEIIGRSVLTLIPAGASTTRRLRFWRVSFVANASNHNETIRMHKDGKRLEVSLSVSPILDANGTVIGAAKIARDITEAKRMQRAEREYTEQLQNLATEPRATGGGGASACRRSSSRRTDDLARALSRCRRLAPEREAAECGEERLPRHHEPRASHGRSNAIAGYLDILLMDIRGRAHRVAARRSRPHQAQ